jgi:hypothetical protein
MHLSPNQLGPCLLLHYDFLKFNSICMLLIIDCSFAVAVPYVD